MSDLACRQRLMRTPLREQVWDITAGNCFYCRSMLLDDDYFSSCGGKVSADDQRLQMHADHKIPRSRGGSDEIENRVPACGLCNMRKSSRTIEEFSNYLFSRNILPNFWGMSLEKRDWLLLQTFPLPKGAI